MKVFLLLAFQSFCVLLIGQQNFLFSNAKNIDHHRYDGIKDSPYQFDSWRPATIYTLKGDPIEVSELNINGYSKEIEIKEGDKFIELDQMGYNKIEILAEDGSIHTLTRNFKNNFKSRFIQLVYEGEKISCVRQFVVPLKEVEIQNVGKTEKINRFIPKFSYIFLKNGKLDEIRVKEKQLLEYLGGKNVMGKVINKSKLKSYKLAHLKEILAHYDAN